MSDFALSYFVYRERERLIQAGIFAVCCVLHLALFVIEIQSGEAGIRTHAFTIDSAIVNVFVYQVVQALFGYHTLAYDRALQWIPRLPPVLARSERGRTHVGR